VPSAKKELLVVVSKDGPYIVSGDVTLAEQVIVADDSGDSVRWQQGDAHQHAEKFALCRCGHSNTPPFCDGTHAKIGFDGTETAARTPYAAQATTFDGPTLSLLDARHLCADGRFCDPNGKVVESSRPYRRPERAIDLPPPGPRLPGRPARRL